MHITEPKDPWTWEEKLTAVNRMEELMALFSDYYENGEEEKALVQRRLFEQYWQHYHFTLPEYRFLVHYCQQKTKK